MTHGVTEDNEKSSDYYSCQFSFSSLAVSYFGKYGVREEDFLLLLSSVLASFSLLCVCVSIDAPLHSIVIKGKEKNKKVCAAPTTKQDAIVLKNFSFLLSRAIFLVKYFFLLVLQLFAPSSDSSDIFLFLPPKKSIDSRTLNFDY
jgi:hypothetical protein